MFKLLTYWNASGFTTFHFNNMFSSVTRHHAWNSAIGARLLVLVRHSKNKTPENPVIVSANDRCVTLLSIHESVTSCVRIAMFYYGNPKRCQRGEFWLRNWLWSCTSCFAGKDMTCSNQQMLMVAASLSFSHEWLDLGTTIGVNNDPELWLVIFVRINRG